MNDTLRKTRKRGPASGFSLIEVLIGLLILALGSTALFSSLGFTKQVQTESVDMNEAGEAANAIIEAFRKMEYVVLEDAIPSGTYVIEDLAVVYTTEVPEVDLLGPGMASLLRSKLNDRRMAESVQVEQEEGAMRLTVTVARDSNPEDPVVEMVAFITQNGINFR